MPRASAPAQADETLVVRYRGRHVFFYAARILPFLVVFVLVAALYLDDEYRRWFFSRNTTAYKPFSWFEFGFLLTLVAAALADLVLTLRRVRPGTIALLVSKDGITGAVRHRSRLITWSEVADVAVDGHFLVIRRQRHKLLQMLLPRYGLSDINIPVRHIDRDVSDILGATRRFAPTSARCAATP